MKVFPQGSQVLTHPPQVVNHDDNDNSFDEDDDDDDDNDDDDDDDDDDDADGDDDDDDTKRNCRNHVLNCGSITTFVNGIPVHTRTHTHTFCRF